jgi:zinc/manganese transport system substrate-binding protein
MFHVMSIPTQRPRRRRLAAGVHGQTVAGRVGGPVAGRVRGPAVVGRVGGAAVVGALAALALAVAGCSSGGNSAADTASSTALINAIGAENEYANVLAQIGGRYVHVSSILNDPNTDPHTFEASPQVAQEVSAADLIVQNGAGYDSWISRIESASPNAGRKVIVVQNLLGLPDSTPNPHLWYEPATMPAVARAMAADLSALQPAHRAYFQANLQRFDSSLTPWLNAIARFKAAHPGLTAATTEPVADYLLTAMGIRNLTPFSFQADIMNGTEPAPQDIALENGFFSRHMVRLFAYNQQVVSALTGSIGSNAVKVGVPVVGVYETMPTPGYDYQTWMLAETNAIEKAVTSKVSTQSL